MQTRAVKWKWRQLGKQGVVLSESPEFSFLAQCMQDAELQGFSADQHVIRCDDGAFMWGWPPELPV